MIFLDPVAICSLIEALHDLLPECHTRCTWGAVSLKFLAPGFCRAEIALALRYSASDIVRDKPRGLDGRNVMHAVNHSYTTDTLIIIVTRLYSEINYLCSLIRKTTLDRLPPQSFALGSRFTVRRLSSLNKVPWPYQ